MKSKSKLVEAIKENVVAPYNEFLLKEIEPSIRLKTSGKECNETGKTKLGGCPDLSREIEWPVSEYDHQFLSFLGQIKLGDVKMFDEHDLLPENGMLYFFFNFNSGDEGRVIFSLEEKGLKRSAFPVELKKKPFWKKLFGKSNENKILLENEVEIYKEYFCPSWDSLFMKRIQRKTNTNVETIDAFNEHFFEANFEEGETEATSNHHLIGHYQGIQNEFHELAFIGDHFINDEKLTIDEIDKALEWRLLFQFDSDNNLGVNYCDGGRVYFFINKHDLMKKNFDRVKIWSDSY